MQIQKNKNQILARDNIAVNEKAQTHREIVKLKAQISWPTSLISRSSLYTLKLLL